MSINNALAMSSLKVNHKKPPQGTFQPQVAIQGKVYYYIGPLETGVDEQPKFAGLYVYDPEMEGALRKNCLYLPASASNQERLTCEEVSIDIQNELHQYNRYVRDFQQMCQISDEDLNDASFVLTEK